MNRFLKAAGAFLGFLLVVAVVVAMWAGVAYIVKAVWQA